MCMFCFTYTMYSELKQQVQHTCHHLPFNCTYIRTDETKEGHLEVVPIVLEIGLGLRKTNRRTGFGF